MAIHGRSPKDDGGDSGSGAPNGRLGEALRQLRRQNGWTLADMSERTGLAISTLSKVENDQMSLTYDKLTNLSEGLGVDITYFFSAQPMEPPPAMAVMARRSINRTGDGEHILTRHYEHWYPSADLSHKRMVPIIAEPKARTLEEFGELLRHPGEEFAMVMEGRIALHTEFYAPVILEKGHSVYFDSTMGHAYLAADDGPCRLLSVCSGTESELKRLVSSDTPPPKPRSSSPRKKP
ncbi:MAG TPA: XRE family transcriptional regulator [Aliidongia sp.]|uniref:helix-turn-helix domain-containing protein n=1 Tax=Aliidongia sp. TaxID=1914230 RepID=UPI002DDCBD8A|nr:XRE family transcriptional regulator [Aliidongia sp.]HEV2678600.1 XRE family transcriptional regulator [Aliidongia sp.]